MSKTKQPKSLSSEDYAALFDRINASNLTTADKATVIAQIKGNWDYVLIDTLDLNFNMDFGEF